jgi:hypothetical protein
MNGRAKKILTLAEDVYWRSDGPDILLASRLGVLRLSQSAGRLLLSEIVGAGRQRSADDRILLNEVIEQGFALEMLTFTTAPIDPSRVCLWHLPDT